MRVGRALSFHASLQVMGWAFTHKSCIGLMPGVGLALPWAMPQLLDVACEVVKMRASRIGAAQKRFRKIIEKDNIRITKWLT